MDFMRVLLHHATDKLAIILCIESRHHWCTHWEG